MTSGAARYNKRLFKRSQSGQSLVILAIGFLALIGFVGIVTDVSLLFVRYSTLRRAVDAAAVAAAGQMRRVDDPNPSDTLAQDQAISYSNMNLAARQFIEFYGLNPSTVLVETCHVQNTPTTNRDPRLCTSDERKLVRVTAQIESPTAFFGIFGFDTIRLEASSISETAVLDLVFIMDVSESMLNETSYAEWADVGYGYRYLPPVLPRPGYGYSGTSSTERTNQANDWAAIIGSTNDQILADLNLGASSTLFDTILPPSERRIIRSGSGTEPRAECRVRFWPGSVLNSRLDNADVINQYISDIGGLKAFTDWMRLTDNDVADTRLPTNMTLDEVMNAVIRWSGFVPMYDYYGCCNDPNGDWDMTDLLCEPFRRARNASIDFMSRLDFIRGDRVAIVTFDRRAYLVDPDPRDNDTRDAMIYSQDIAEQVMRERVGVRTEPSFYADSDSNGRWDAFMENGVSRGWVHYNTNTRVGAVVDHPVRNACPMDGAILAYPYGLYTNANGTSYRYGSDPNFPVILDEIDTLPSWYNIGTMGATPPDSWLRLGVAPNPGVGVIEFYDRLRRSYEYRGSCAGTNIGEGLGRASEVLGRLGRREGAVWIMVLLSDGAAGASAPVFRNGTLAQPPVPYNPSGINGGTAPVGRGFANGYGAYGLCPYGFDPTDASAPPRTRSSNAYNTNQAPYPAELLQDLRFPYCTDVQPYTRHFCGDRVAAPSPDQIGPNVIDLADEASCDRYYDPDDFARDWADYISVRGINLFQRSVTNVDTTINDTDTLLPTIFTIGFGLEFNASTGCSLSVFGNALYDCNAESYLGEELLRYIADAGDNFRIDNDYWQQLMAYRIPNRVADLALGQTADWGPRGPCENPTGAQGTWSPLGAGTNCGNYWAASTAGGELEEVFAEIAARMFTRLSG